MMCLCFQKHLFFSSFEDFAEHMDTFSVTWLRNTAVDTNMLKDYGQGSYPFSVLLRKVKP